MKQVEEEYYKADEKTSQAPPGANGVNNQTNTTQFFDINTQKYGQKIHCTAKASGNIGVNYFSAKFKFVVNAKNPIPIFIPCHRVIGSDGQLVGYSGGNGLATKAFLLNLM